MTNASIGYGTLLKVGDGATPEVFTTIAKVTSIKPPNLSAGSVDVTHHESPGAMREFIPGLKDGGEVPLEINFDPGSATTDLLTDMFASRATKNCKIVYPDSSEWAFKAFVMSFEPDAPIADKMTASVKLKVTGEVTFTQA